MEARPLQVLGPKVLYSWYESGVYENKKNDQNGIDLKNVIIIIQQMLFVLFVLQMNQLFKRSLVIMQYHSVC